MYTLGKEVGLHAETLGKKLEEAINEIIRNRWYDFHEFFLLEKFSGASMQEFY